MSDTIPAGGAISAYGTVTIRSRTIALWLATIVAAVASTAIMITSWSAEAAPGDADTTYVPIAPCRLFDTRAGAFNVGPRSTPLGEAESHEQQVTGDVGQCTGIPADATGVSMNVTATNATAASFLTLFPGNLAAPPNASNLNWVAGQPPTPNKVDVALSPTGTIKVFNRWGSVDVLADVVGYYTPTSLRVLDDRFAIYETPLAATTINANDTHQYAALLCDVGDTAIGAWIRSTSNNQGGIEVHSVQLNGRVATVYLGNMTAVQLTLQGGGTCLNTSP